MAQAVRGCHFGCAEAFVAESFPSPSWFANSESFESNSACLSGQHAIQCRSWQSQTRSLHNPRQKGNGKLVTRWEYILNIHDRNGVFLYLSSAIWQFFFILLSHTMVSAENPPCRFSLTLWVTVLSDVPSSVISASTSRPHSRWDTWSPWSTTD